jgi:hypothetical protein
MTLLSAVCERRFDVDLAVRYVTGCVATRRKAVGSTSIAARPSFFQTTLFEVDLVEVIDRSPVFSIFPVISLF